MLVGAGLLFLAFGERLGYQNPVPEEYRFYEPYLPAPGGVAVPGAELPGTGEGADTADLDALDADALDADDPDVEVTTVPVEPTEPDADDATAN